MNAKQTQASRILSRYLSLMLEKIGAEWDSQNQADIEHLITLLSTAHEPTRHALTENDLLVQAVQAWHRSQDAFAHAKTEDDQFNVMAGFDRTKEDAEEARTLALLSLAQNIQVLTGLLADVSKTTKQIADHLESALPIDDEPDLNYCSECSKSAIANGHAHWLTCDICGVAICDTCMIQKDDGRYCTDCGR